MPSERRTYTAAEELALTTQVDGQCPLCKTALFYTKKSRSFKAYELAHIYPLNPTPEEVEALKGVRLLHVDVNHPDNQIPLCTGCHTRFDKPRTRDEYEELAAKKRDLIEKAAQRSLRIQYPIDDEIRRIIDALHRIDIPVSDGIALRYDAKSLNDKFDITLPLVTRQKIKHAVADYYQYIKTEFREMERNAPTSSQLIFTQVKAYYLKQATLDLTQADMFRNVVDWIRDKTGAQTEEAAEIVASFFIQNCEVFE